MARVLGRPLDTRTVALSVAGLLAAGTGLLTFNYLAAIGHRVATSAQRQVIVAAKTIPAHATITAAMLVAAKRPADAVDPDAVVAPGGAIGLSAVNEIPVGSTITASKLAHALPNGLPGRVRPGMRAVSIALDRVKGVSNLLQAGDRVDVIAVTTPRTDGTPKAAAIIRGARILSIGQQIDTPTSANASPSPDQATTATLEVTPQQADLLTLADVDATLRLALRSPRDNARNEKAETISFSAPPPPRPAIAAPAKPAVAAPVAQRTPQPKPTSPVLVIDGGTAYHPTL
jgi:pilus assembly protein CpaB